MRVKFNNADNTENRMELFLFYVKYQPMSRYIQAKIKPYKVTS